MRKAVDGACRNLEDAIVSEVHNRLLVGWRKIDRPAQAVRIVQEVVHEVLRHVRYGGEAPRVLCLVSLEGGGVRLRAAVRPTQRADRAKGGKVLPMRKGRT